MEIHFSTMQLQNYMIDDLGLRLHMATFAIHAEDRKKKYTATE